MGLVHRGNIGPFEIVESIRAQRNSFKQFFLAIYSNYYSVLTHLKKDTFYVLGANSYRVHNYGILMNALENRPKDIPLITVANHISCMDEPLLWGEKSHMKYCLHDIAYRLFSANFLFT